MLLHLPGTDGSRASHKPTTPEANDILHSNASHERVLRAPDQAKAMPNGDLRGTPGATVDLTQPRPDPFGAT